MAPMNNLQQGAKQRRRVAVLRIVGIPKSQTVPNSTHQGEILENLGTEALPKQTELKDVETQKACFSEGQVALRRKKFEMENTMAMDIRESDSIGPKGKTPLRSNIECGLSSKRTLRRSRRKKAKIGQQDGIARDSILGDHRVDEVSTIAGHMRETQRTICHLAIEAVGVDRPKSHLRPNRSNRNQDSMKIKPGMSHEDVNSAIQHIVEGARLEPAVQNGIWRTVADGTFETKPLQVMQGRAVLHIPSRYLHEMHSLYALIPIDFPDEPGRLQPVVEIRLITILPEFMGESIMCTMYKTNIREGNNKFVALSYAWGSVDKTHCIQVRGSSVPVTRSLYKALLQLRKPSDSVTVWADAICIDQDNIRERNYQVKQMPKIYSAAAEVVAWAGDSTNQTDRVMDLISGVTAKVRRANRTQEVDDVVDFFSRDYWHRVWVVQEIAAVTRTRRPCTLRCGAKNVSFDKLKSFLQKFRMDWNKHGVHISPRALLSLSTADSTRTFLQVLREASPLQARDDRDRIYGIRGISPKNYRDSIEVDYKVSFEKLSEKVMAEIINKDRSLDMLCLFKPYSRPRASSEEIPRVATMTQDPPSNYKLPSWLCDFRKVYAGICPEIFSACKRRPAVAGVRNQVLFARGICIDSMQEMHVFKRSPKTFSTERGDMTNDSNLLDRLKASYPKDTVQTRIERCIDINSGGKLRAIELFDEIEGQAWKATWGKKLNFEGNNVPWDMWYPYEQYLRRFSPTLFDRCCFLTKEGRIGLGPQTMEVGDLVCILYGCQMPVVLRKSGRYCTFVGPIYLDGAMCGESIADVSGKGERFRIR